MSNSVVRQVKQAAEQGGGPMTFDASWVHGTALTVEAPQNLDRVGYFGWGADMQIRPGKSSWFHIPLPTPVITHDVRTTLERVFILFKTDSGSIRNVHVYDGSAKVHEFNDLLLAGEHRINLDNENRFDLPEPHVVAFGIGISFFYQADIGFDSAIPPPRLIVATAGGDYRS
jgi:hypothetical protein